MQILLPHYQNLVDTTLNKIKKGELRLGDTLPSLNQAAEDFNVSRDTVLSAYKILKEKGVVKAIPGKGYFVATTDIKASLNVFLLFDELNAFKEDLYNSFIENLGANTRVDIYFHHFNRKLFERLITENAGTYTHYVIMPTQFTNVSETLSILPKERTYILDQSSEELNALYSSVFQSFEEDTYTALVSAKSLLNKYKKLIMLHPGGKEPEGQKKGFIKFCEAYDIPYEILKEAKEKKIRKHVAYVTPSDRFLVNLVKQAKSNRWKLGRDIGIISYNETPLKEVVADGITTISTDFPQMGKILAELIKSNKKENIQNQLLFTKRNSI